MKQPAAAENGPVFALDCSGRTAGVCVLRGTQVLYEQTLDEGLTHSQTLLALAHRAFSACGMRPAQVGVFAVTAGPGSFTGLRIGLALAKGLALPAGRPAVPVSTLRAVATALADESDALIVPALDARRKEVYWAAFAARGGHAERLLPDAAGPAKKIQENINKYWENPVKYVGSGAELCYNALDEAHKADAEWRGDPLPIARGAALAARQLAAEGRAADAAALVPRYLRLSQAERQRNERIAPALPENPRENGLR